MIGPGRRAKTVPTGATHRFTRTTGGCVAAEFVAARHLNPAASALPAEMQRATIVSMAWGPDSETIPVPAAVRFPVELMPPPGFCPNDPATWPAVDGRLEYVDGRLLYMPPCGAVQQAVAASVAGVLDRWLDDHPDFFVGANDAGMMFGRDVRGTEGAVFWRDALGPISGGYSRVPPILAVEVAGREEGEPELRVKAAWYLSRGVRVVWRRPATWSS